MMGHGNGSMTRFAPKYVKEWVATSTQRLAHWTGRRVKTTQMRGLRGYDAGKKVNGRKRHILVDTLGLLLAVVVTSAAVSDPAGARLLLRRLGGACKKLRRIWVDGTYRGHLLEWVMLHYRFVLQPVLRCDGQKGFVVLPRRWVVENTQSQYP